MGALRLQRSRTVKAPIVYNLRPGMLLRLQQERDLGHPC